MNNKPQTATILIPEDTANPGKEQTVLFQQDGVNIQVKRGVFAEVPLWVAERAKEIGEITDYRLN